MNDRKNIPINLNCLNCRGIRNQNKRQTIFNWLKTSYNGLTFLQETHSTISDEKKWETEWGGKIYYSHGEFNSKGVAIMIPDNISNFSFIEEKKDTNGRIILVKCEIDQNFLTLINVYSPTKDKLKKQLDFLVELKSFIDIYSNDNLIIGGDFNTYLNINIDKKGGNLEKQSTYANNLISLCEEYSLCDIWRIRNPHNKIFTRRENSKSGLIQSRLDYWLISISLTFQTLNCDIKPSICTDHSLITLTLNLIHTQQRGKGTWKFNNSLLRDPMYIKLIKETISNITINVEIENKNTLWDYTKCEIRTKTIEYSKIKAKQNKENEKLLLKKLESLEKTLDNSELEFLQYKQTKLEYENLNRIKTQGAIIRSRATWAEDGEKNTKYFINLEKRNYNLKYITKLISNNNKEITNPNEILKEQKQFYQKLYSTKQTSYNSNQSKTFLNKLRIPKLTVEQKQSCDDPITI